MGTPLAAFGPALSWSFFWKGANETERGVDRARADGRAQQGKDGDIWPGRTDVYLIELLQLRLFRFLRSHGLSAGTQVPPLSMRTPLADDMEELKIV